MTHPLKEPKKYWDEIWSANYASDRITRLNNMVKDLNTKEHWDELWKDHKKFEERWCRLRTNWIIRHTEGIKSILDVGCGNGRTLYMLKNDYEVYGIDISETAIKKMKNKYKVDGEEMDVRDLPNLNRKFDAVICNHTLEHIQDDVKLVKDIYDKLNENGILIVAVPNNILGPDECDEHLRKYTGKELADLIRGVFGNVEIDFLGKNLIATTKKDVN